MSTNLKLLKQSQPIVKVHRVFPSSYLVIASSQLNQFHRVNSGDSRAVVTPFMQGR